MRILVLDADEVIAACPMADCIKEMADVFALQGQGRVDSPLRSRLAVPAGDVLIMPSMARRAKAEASVKVVSVFPKNKAGVPSINAVTLLVDGETGEPKGMLSGGVLTAIRTGAVSGLSCRYLARKDSKTMGIVGAGGMAYQQVNGVVSELPSIKNVRVFSMDRAGSKALAKRCADSLKVEASVVEEVDACVRGSDVLVTATTSRTPVFRGSVVEEGTHVIAMGSYRPEAREVDSDFVSRASIFVDSKEAVLEEAGDLLIPIGERRLSESAIKAELSELVSGKKRGRASRSEVTFFKCVGLAFEDNAAGWLAYRRALKLGIGKWSEL
ncbi:MAG TPA: ornithine cyclodeaminase family protein [Nitrososphaerales archaeon]|nr:ornithine cyclodeaminase family protein [Nitrososphaerales archaeon]